MIDLTESTIADRARRIFATLGEDDFHALLDRILQGLGSGLFDEGAENSPFQYPPLLRTTSYRNGSVMAVSKLAHLYVSVVLPALQEPTQDLVGQALTKLAQRPRVAVGISLSPDCPLEIVLDGPHAEPTEAIATARRRLREAMPLCNHADGDTGEDAWSLRVLRSFFRDLEQALVCVLLFDFCDDTSSGVPAYTQAGLGEELEAQVAALVARALSPGPSQEPAKDRAPDESFRPVSTTALAVAIAVVVLLVVAVAAVL